MVSVESVVVQHGPGTAPEHVGITPRAVADRASALLDGRNP